MCTSRKGCGRVYAKYETKIEDKLGQQFTNTIDNPHDIGKSIVSLDNKKKLSPVQKERHRQKDRIQKEKDEDIKRELRKGNIVRDIRFGVLNQKIDRS